MGDEQSNRRSSDGQTATVGIAIAAVVAVIVLLCVCIVVVIAILTLLGPTIGNVFSSQLAVQECWFETDVIVFEDANANQAQDESEAGIEDVTVNLTVDGTVDLVELTDEDGFVHLWWYDPACGTAKTFEVVVDVPPGNQATTPITFGPYEVTFIGGAGTLYVGLK